MTQQNRKINIMEATKLANVYYNEGRKLASSHMEVGEDLHDLVCRYIVGYTNMAFACEIALKVLIVSQGGTPKVFPQRHLLSELVSLLRDDIKTAVVHVTKVRYEENTKNEYSDAEFYQDLEKYSDAFVKARYWYERQPDGESQNAGIAFMTAFAGAVVWMISIGQEAKGIKK